jgi:hypothetical protein
MHEVRASHQRWLATMFGDRLPDEPAARERAIQSLHVVTDAYAWRLLRRDLGVSRDEAESIMVRLVEAMLGPVGNGATMTSLERSSIAEGNTDGSHEAELRHDQQ